MTAFAFQNLILRAGRLIKKFSCTLSVMARKKMIQFVLLQNDTDIYLNLISITFVLTNYFGQGITKDKDRINYHNIFVMADHLDKEIHQILPRFHHTSTGSDFTNSLFGGSKCKALKKMLETPKSHKL